jgi:hypothetical protein
VVEKTFFLDIPDLDRVVMGWEERGSVDGDGLGIVMLGFGIGEITWTTFVVIWEEGEFVRTMGSSKWAWGVGLGRDARGVFVKG